MKMLAVACGVVVLSSCVALAGLNAQREKGKVTKIVFIGDSNTRGTPHVAHGTPEFPGDPNPIPDSFNDNPYEGGPGAKSAYVNLLRQRLGRGFELHNRGRGATAALAWASDREGILTEVEKLDPDYVVLYVGLSGVVLKEKRADFEKGMKSLVSKVKAWRNVKRIFVVNVPPVALEDLAPVIRSYNRWLTGLRGVKLIDVNSVLADEKGVIQRRYVDYPDVYHQNYNGHYEVAQLLFDAFLDTGVLRSRNKH